MLTYKTILHPILRTTLSHRPSLCFSKRYVNGGKKPLGHARKILDIIDRPTPPPVNPVNNTVPNSENIKDIDSHLPSNFNDMLDNLSSKNEANIPSTQNSPFDTYAGPIKSEERIADKVKQSSPKRAPIEDNANSNVEPASTNNLTPAEKDLELIHVINPEGAIDDIWVPVAPPLPPAPVKYNPTIGPYTELQSKVDGKVITTPLKEELEKVYQKKQENQQSTLEKLSTLDNELDLKAETFRRTQYLLEQLAERKLINIEESKVTTEFYTYWVKTHTKGTLDVHLSLDDSPQFKIGLLTVTEKDATILLSGQQMHPIIVYTHNQDNIIVWGYLTSENKGKVIELSSYQPFSENKDKMQYLQLVKPYAAHSTTIEDMPQNQSQAAIDYVIKLDSKFQQIFNEQVMPKIKGPLNIYDGTGITLNEIEKVIKSYDKAQVDKAQIYFEKYKQKLNQNMPTDKWLEKIKRTDNMAYEHLLKIIKNYETNQ